MLERSLEADEESSGNYRTLLVQYKQLRVRFAPMAHAWMDLSSGMDTLPQELPDQVDKSPEVTEEDVLNVYQQTLADFNRRYGFRLRVVVEDSVSTKAA